MLVNYVLEWSISELSSFPAVPNSHPDHKLHHSDVCPTGRTIGLPFKREASLHMTRILIADDSEQVRKSLRHLLEQHEDWEVCGEAIDGLDTLDTLAQLASDVIVLELAMPGLAG